MRVFSGSGCRRLAVVLGCGLAFAAAANAATLTLNYNGFNPGVDVVVYTSTLVALTNHPAAVAGDTETSFSFDLTAAGNYIINLWGGDCATRAGYRIQFVFDGTDIDSLVNGSAMLSGFTANTTTLTLNTVPIYVDPNGFNPPDDSPDGYVVQLEFGTSSRSTLGAFSTYANGGRAGTVVNGGFRYMIHYLATDRDSLGQQFVINNGVVANEIGLLDEGTTTDAFGDEAGNTHQLVRLNPTSINVDLNGLSHGLVLADGDANAYPIDNLPAGFNGSAEVLIHTDFGHLGYKFDYTRRLQKIAFDVNASGDIIDLNDIRAAAVGNTITFKTVEVEIDVAPSVVFSVLTKDSPINSNTTGITGNLTGDQVLKLLPMTSTEIGVYYLGGIANDARYTFRIIYDPATRKFSLTTWTNVAGTLPLTGQSTITLFSGAVVTILGPPKGTVFVVR